MIDIGIATFGGILFLLGHYTQAFWLVVLAIISGALAVAKAIIDPNWYFDQRAKAGLDVSIMNPRRGIGALLVTKLVVISALTWIAWKLGEKAGYFA